MSDEWTHVWRVRARLPERFGQMCRVVIRGGMNSVLVEFERDRYRVVTSRWFVRVRQPSEDAQQVLFPDV